MEKILTAIQNKDFTGDEDGIPVLNYDHVKDAEVNVGLGPLHTQFDDQMASPIQVCLWNSASPNGNLGRGKSSTRFRSATTSGTSALLKATPCIQRKISGGAEQALARTPYERRPITARKFTTDQHQLARR